MREYDKTCEEQTGNYVRKAIAEGHSAPICPDCGGQLESISLLPMPPILVDRCLQCGYEKRSGSNSIKVTQEVPYDAICRAIGVAIELLDKSLEDVTPPAADAFVLSAKVILENLVERELVLNGK